MEGCSGESEDQVIKVFPKPEGVSRLETGPTQFGDDWPGVFIRGDRACYYAMLLRLHVTGDTLEEKQLLGLADLLDGCNLTKVRAK